MKPLIAISGTTSGIGGALYNILLDYDIYLVSIARRIPDSTNKQPTADVYQLLMDLKNPIESLKKWESWMENFQKKVSKVIFINNAGSVEPIKPVGDMPPDTILQSINVNFSSPVLLTQAIFNFARQNSALFQLLNISSGAANRAIPSWSVYCSTKAAMQMFANCIAAETDVTKVQIWNVDPGVVDTDMQQLIRQSSRQDFPLVEQFQQIKAEGKLQSPHEAAVKLLAYLSIQ